MHKIERIGSCMRVVAAAVVAVVAVFAVARSVAAEASAMATALESIDAEQLRVHAGTLADDSFEGREAGTRGGRAAATYVMKQLEADGLSPGGDRGGYFQAFKAYRNVLAVLEGSDPKLKDEYIVVGAHFDHVGYGSKKNSYGTGYIHNGADDNASGTAALLEVAQAFSALPQAPRRSIVFACWDAEEKGLLGSKHWIEHPTVPLEKVRINLNADMVGRMVGEKVIVYGTRTGAGLRHFVAEANESSDLQVSYVWWINPRSDHYTFVKNKIPALLLHTGLHNDYHRPTDDADKLNVAGMQRISRLYFSLAYELAQRDEIPAWRKAGAWESSSQRKTYEAAPAAKPPRLGVTWDDASDHADTPGVLVKSLTRGSAAAAAGVAVGDRILKFDGRDVNSGDQLRRRVLAAQRNVEIVVARDGEQQPRTLQATLSGQPVQLGISWRKSDAEPGAVTVVHVVAGSPAADAGIERLDRVWAVDGHPLESSQTLETIALPKNRPVRFDLERDGRLLSVELTPNGR